ncbi:probable Dolichyl pyrophosphate Man9GlcNAc2 alpha-1,3-glucosyltransferase [Zygosaccharomyces bailii]|nr:probable Dolichyl pyrophosphate Man9GlcNAc2 alpha-1,3-glucosyltransferase [Zygosaccharomyces bailii]
MPSKNLKKLGKNKAEGKAEEVFYASPLYDFLFPFKPAGSQWVTEYIIVLFAVIIRCAIGLGSYSGQGIKPMHGDFEAQRHWMEITQHLPISKWYYFDLKYWGLDYPPLTAYHSYFLGKLGSFINPTWFALDRSRGLETDDLKTYMRLTVIVSELFFYIPAVVYFTKWVGRHRKQSPIGQFIAAAAILFQPSLMLIDHGHFQYNSVMLGFTVYAINNLMDEFYGPAAACFVLSICFKQMALYYAPIFFAYLLSRSLFKIGIRIPRLLSVATATIATFSMIYLPLYLCGDGFKNIVQSLHRIFPFARGIFEDKVANFWCVTNVIVKYKILFTQQQLQLYSLIATSIGFLPAVFTVFLYPKKHLVPYALAACSMSFFLFSFQVHEKSILVPLLPITLLYTSTNWDVLSLVSWINNVGLFTLWPLLKKDGLVLQYFVCFALCNWLIGNFSFVTPTFLPNFLTPGPSVSSVDIDYRRRSLLPSSVLWKLVIVGSYIAMGVIHILDWFVFPPPDYPDLWVILNCSLGFGCFALFWLWNYYKLFTLAGKTLQQL